MNGGGPGALWLIPLLALLIAACPEPFWHLARPLLGGVAAGHAAASFLLALEEESAALDLPPFENFP
ncbi:hypothetical protein NON00_02590 [Roseomonas sp. GC11]|uniref:hypothetical protein n=1 Tax=Roseomonas sp. GC11 TaxID=2950546 RepID=UPI00210CEDAE|nr:hypothetical protein [Roseomonas sp. GC11]MCQ4158814.1 hypothetical protein [Roseomonas sp. GC11]